MPNEAASALPLFALTGDAVRAKREQDQRSCEGVMHDLAAHVHRRTDIPMKKRLGVVVVCGLGIAFASCGSDTGGKPGAKPDGAADAGADVPVDTAAGVAVDAGIMPLPVLDPNGTYGGKTHAEWQAADQRHYL